MSSADEYALLQILISYYEENPCFYQKSDKNYSNMIFKRNRAELIGTYCGLSGEQVLDKFRYLREKFNKECGKLDDQCRSGAGATTTSKWEFMDSLMFLKDHIIHRKAGRSSNMDAAHAISPIEELDDAVETAADVEEINPGPSSLASTINKSPPQLLYIKGPNPRIVLQSSAALKKNLQSGLTGAARPSPSATITSGALARQQPSHTYNHVKPPGRTVAAGVLAASTMPVTNSVVKSKALEIANKFASSCAVPPSAPMIQAPSTSTATSGATTPVRARSVLPKTPTQSQGSHGRKKRKQEDNGEDEISAVDLNSLIGATVRMAETAAEHRDRNNQRGDHIGGILQFIGHQLGILSQVEQTEAVMSIMQILNEAVQKTNL